MHITKTHKIIITVVVAALLFGAYVLFDRRSNTAEGDNNIANNSEQVSTTTGSGTQVITTADGQSYTIEQVPLSEGKGIPQPVPDLNRQVTVYAGVTITPEARALAVSKITELQTRLKANNADLEAWINLGIYQKQAGDYNGAILSWKYAGRLAPSDYISLGNLGNLYAYFMKDNGQAEVYYKQAIAKGPTQAYLYLQLGEIYRDIFNDKARARALMEEGLAKMPNNQALIAFKATLN